MCSALLVSTGNTGTLGRAAFLVSWSSHLPLMLVRGRVNSCMPQNKTRIYLKVLQTNEHFVFVFKTHRIQTSTQLLTSV